MRILHVVEVDHGGVVTYVREAARLQAAAGDEVHVLAPGPPVCSRSYPQLVAASPRHPQHGRGPPPAGRTGRRGRARRRAPPLLLSRPAGPRQEAGGARVAYQPHSWAFAAAPRAARPLVKLVERAGLRCTDVVVVNCRSEAEEGRRRGTRHPSACRRCPRGRRTVRAAPPAYPRSAREDR